MIYIVALYIGMFYAFFWIGTTHQQMILIRATHVYFSKFLVQRVNNCVKPIQSSSCDTTLLQQILCTSHIGLTIYNIQCAQRT